MRTFLCIAVLFAGMGQVAVRCAAENVRAAVITKTTSANYKPVPGKFYRGRHELQAGHVYEVAPGPPGMPELKIDGDQSVMVSPAFVKVRECTPAELAAAQKRFNQFSLERERESIKESCDKQLAGLKKGMCSSCPKVRKSASKRASDVRNQRNDKLRELDKRERDMLQQALAWAAGK